MPGYNQEVQAVAAEHGLKYVVLEPTFQLDDRSLNLSLYNRDRLHLSKKGTSALLKTIHQTVPILHSRLDKSNAGSKPQNQKPAGPHHSRKQHRQRCGSQHRDHAGSPSSQSSQGNQVICYSCGIPGHTQRVCKHKNHEVVCYDCGASRHKSKYCNAAK